MHLPPAATPHLLPKPRHRPATAFSLLEILAVLAIVLILGALAGPQIIGLPPRQVALFQLKSALEGARSEAIRSDREVLVAFTDHLSGASFDRAADYRFNHFAVFARDLTGPQTNRHHPPDPITCPLTELRGWTRLPEGTLFALGEDLPVHPDGVSPVLTIIDGSKPATACSALREFPFPAEGADAVRRLPFLMFNREGQVTYPQFFETSFLHIGIVEGTVAGTDGNERIITATLPTARGADKAAHCETLSLSPRTGRIRVFSPAP